MGLDACLTWVGKVSYDRVKLYDSCNRNIIPYDSIDEDELDTRGKYLKDKLAKINANFREFDWDLMKEDCGEPPDAQICMLGSNGIGFGTATNHENFRKYSLDIYDERYEYYEMRPTYIFDSEEIYRWRNRYDIRAIFDKAYPDEDGDMLYATYVPVTEEMLEEIKNLDPVFAEEYEGKESNLFFKADW